MRNPKIRSLAAAGLGLLVVLLSPSPSFLQDTSGAIVREHPEIEGVYQVKLDESKIIIQQVYFKDGVLRTLTDGDGTVSVWNAVEGEPYRFTTTSERNGVFFLTFEQDDSGAYSRYHVVNEKTRLDTRAYKLRGFNDPEADPYSRSDRLGYIERQYQKSQHLVPMRDGARLMTHVYSPLDTSETHPILIFRDPYGIEPYDDVYRASVLPSLFFAKAGYILVYQDIRGRARSEGSFDFLAPYIADKKTPSDVDESSDAYDTVEWLLANVPNHNGRVGVWGSSYPGFTAAMAAIGAHPAVKAVSIQAPMGDLFLGDDGHHNGAFYLSHYAGYSYGIWVNRDEPAPFHGRSFPYGTPDGYDFFLNLGPLDNITAAMFKEPNGIWDEAMAHETYDSYWQSRSIYRHLLGIKPAVMVVGGWYDGEDLLGTLRTYKTIEKHNPGIQNTLTMGPWMHSAWNQTYGRNEKRGPFSYDGTSAFYMEKVEFPFFEAHLRGVATPAPPEALVYDTGIDAWESYESWPPVRAERRKFVFSEQGRLASAGESPPPRTEYDEFVSDPAKPVPYSLTPDIPYNRDYFVEDQRFASSRPDVLVYVSEPLTEGARVAGPIGAELYVSTTGTDADWVVKVIDVYPGDAPNPENAPRSLRMGGYQRLVRGDIIRGKFRSSFEDPKPFVPGEVEPVSFELPDIAHTFRKGHRIMVHVQSSWFPLFDRNPQIFCDIRKAREEDFRKATHRVYRTADRPSGISMWLLPRY
ncbi:MAG: CocE/NonD family hydrolase [Candidatus Aminicenantes bacterium]|nr:CocE/NonD family hydrolase [Candidatus Aminicenantes bacterium]